MLFCHLPLCYLRKITLYAFYSHCEMPLLPKMAQLHLILKLIKELFSSSQIVLYKTQQLQDKITNEWYY